MAWEDESKEILENISSIFSKETSEEILNSNFNKAKEQIKDLIQTLENAKAKKNRENLTNNLKKAYFLIMNIRTLLLGSSSEIKYRIYIRGTDLSDVRIVDINEEELFKIIERSGDNLRLKRSFDAINSIETNTNIQNLFNQHFDNIQRSLRQVKANNFVVRDDVIAEYGESSHYMWMEEGPEGKSYATRKMFNRGWIYQAFDATVFDISNNNIENLQDLSLFRKTYFKEKLVYDNVTGFKGGDVGLNQIKSNMANLMSITNLIKYLKIIQNILDKNFINTNNLREYILKEFTTQESLSSDIEKEVSTNVDNLLNNILKLKT